MNVVLNSLESTLLSFTPEEMVGLCNALNEVCNNQRIAGSEFQTRLGVTREFLARLLAQMPSRVSSANHIAERTDVWATDGAVHVLCISASGDPVELGETEAKAFAKRLQQAIGEAT